VAHRKNFGGSGPHNFGSLGGVPTCFSAGGGIRQFRLAAAA